MRFKGNAVAVTILYLFLRARSQSQNSLSPTDVPTDVSIRASVKGIADKKATGLSVTAVNKALNVLVKGKFIIKENNKSDSRNRSLERGHEGEFLAGKICLTNPDTGEILQTTGAGVCFGNELTPYLQIPVDAVKLIFKMKPAERAVYLAVFQLASSFGAAWFPVSKSEIREKSKLGKNAFNRAFKACRNKRLLTYGAGKLQVNDPLTRKLPNREKKEWIRHEDAQYSLQYKDITPDEWLLVIQDGKLLNRELQWRYPNKSGWSVKSGCPFCGEYQFTVNIQTRSAKCFETRPGKKGGCGFSEPLAKFIGKVLYPNDTDMTNTNGFIKKCLDPMRLI